MRKAFSLKPILWGLGILAILSCMSGTIIQAKEAANGVWIDDRAEPLQVGMVGKYLHLDENRLLCVAGNRCHVSLDGGKHWEVLSTLVTDKNIQVGFARDVLRTKKGTIIVPFSNGKEKKWTWKNELHDAPGAVLPTYVVRSLDDGKTWLPPQKIHNDWTGDNSAIIQTSKGRVVLASMHMLHNPGRHAVVTYYSDDEGETWKSSHAIDLGGCGHHDGTMEAAMEELGDGRLWLLIRTNWNRFWNAYSDDGGASWRTIGPSDIDASSSPGFLRRLKSGRIALVWNRVDLSDKASYPKRGGEGFLAEVPNSWQRAELSLAFSDDEGKTWTDPVVIARKPKSRLEYPCIFEAKPGTLWILAGPARLVIKEKDFVQKD